MQEDGTAAASQDAATPRVLAPWASLSFPSFRLLWIGSPFATTASQMRQMVNLWMVYQITGSAAQLGLTGLFQGASALVMGPLGGTVVDRVDRRRLIIVAQSLQLVLNLSLFFIARSGHLQVWHLYLFTAAHSGISPFDGTARAAITPSLVPKSHLINAITLVGAAGQGAFFMGPLLGGIVLATTNEVIAYFLCAVLVLPSLATILMLRLPPAKAQRRADFAPRELFDGLRFMWQTQVLFGLVLLDAVAMVFGFYPALLPIFAQDILRVGPAGLGYLASAPAIGSALGYLTLAAFSNVKRKGLIMLLISLLYSLFLIGFALSPWFALCLVTVACMGFLDAVSVSIRRTSFLMLSPEEMRGRSMSVPSMFAFSSNSLGAVYAGFAASVVGARWALVIGGMITTAFVTGVMLKWRKVREFQA